MIKKVIHGDIVATLRAEARLTQEELAQLAGCSQSYLSRAETTRRRVSAPLIQRLTEVLTDKLGRPITVDDLTGDPDFCPTCLTPLAQSA